MFHSTLKRSEPQSSPGAALKAIDHNLAKVMGSSDREAFFHRVNVSDEAHCGTSGRHLVAAAIRER